MITVIFSVKKYSFGEITERQEGRQSKEYLKVYACLYEQENDELRNQIIVLRRDLGVRTKQIGTNPLFCILPSALLILKISASKNSHDTIT